MSRSKVRTQIGTQTVREILVRGRPLATDIIGTFDFVDMMFFTSLGRTPSDPEKVMVNTLLVTVCDHGLTPSALAARLTFLGAPESLQGGVAAGLLGAGSVFLGSMQNVADMLIREAAPLDDGASDAAVDDLAAAFVSQARKTRAQIHGIGHPYHIYGDPRIPRLADISKANGFFGKHWRLMLAVERAFEANTGRLLPMNAAGGTGAIVADMGLPSAFAKGIALVGRSAGLVAHLIEEASAPVGQAVWDLVLMQDERNELPPSKAKT